MCSSAAGCATFMQAHVDDDGNDFSDIECAFQNKTICEKACYDQAFQVYDSFKTGTCVGNSCLKSKVYKYFSEKLRRRLDLVGSQNYSEYGNGSDYFYGNGSSLGEGEDSHNYGNDSKYGHDDHYHGNGSGYGDGGHYYGNGSDYGSGGGGTYPGHDGDGRGHDDDHCNHPFMYAGSCYNRELFFDAIKNGEGNIPSVLQCLR